MNPPPCDFNLRAKVGVISAIPYAANKSSSFLLYLQMMGASVKSTHCIIPTHWMLSSTANTSHAAKQHHGNLTKITQLIIRGNEVMKCLNCLSSFLPPAQGPYAFTMENDRKWYSEMVERMQKKTIPLLSLGP